MVRFIFKGVRKFILSVMALSLLAGLGYAQPEAVPGEILVRFKSEVSQDQQNLEASRLGLSGQSLPSLRRGLLAQQGLVSLRRVEALQMEKVKVPSGLTEAEALRKLAASPLVQSGCLNYYRELFTLPNDPLYQQGFGWWAKATGADKVVDENILPVGAPVTIAVLDTGVYLAHEDLAGRCVMGYDFVHDRGNGDVSNYGLTVDNPFYGDYAHGTHVSGIAAAATNNGLGIVGTASAANITVMPLRVGDLFLDSKGNTFVAVVEDALIAGVTWAADNGARVLNMSLGGPYDDPILDEALQYAYDHGCVLVASAGNSAQRNSGNPPALNRIMYPAAAPHVIAVAACDVYGEHAPYSEFGSFVALAAPGGYQADFVANNSTEVLSTIPYGHFSGQTDIIKYYPLQGTSMAAPAVSGVAAMLLAQNPKLTPDEVLNIMISTAEKTGSLASAGKNWDPYLGWGRVSLYRALTRGQNATYSNHASSKPAYNYPNPFDPLQGDKTNIVIPLDTSASPPAVKIQIYDISGRPVWALALAAGEAWSGKSVVWDGRNDKGELVANGIYPFVIHAGSQTYSNKIAVNNE